MTDELSKLIRYDTNVDPWVAEIGNPSPCRLGESHGEVQGEGATPEEAVKNMIAGITGKHRRGK